MLGRPGQFPSLPDVREVVGHGNCNDTMLQRSAQVLLVAENELFEGTANSDIRSKVTDF